MVEALSGEVVFGFVLLSLLFKDFSSSSTRIKDSGLHLNVIVFSFNYRLFWPFDDLTLSLFFFDLLLLLDNSLLRLCPAFINKLDLIM